MLLLNPPQEEYAHHWGRKIKVKLHFYTKRMVELRMLCLVAAKCCKIAAICRIRGFVCVHTIGQYLRIRVILEGGWFMSVCVWS